MSKYLTYEERFYIEKALKNSDSPTKIAETLGKHFTTIYKEIKKGTVTFLNSDLTTRKEYCADAAQVVTQKRGHNKEKSIIYRPEEIGSREQYGHWEIDTVYRSF